MNDYLSFEGKVHVPRYVQTAMRSGGVAEDSEAPTPGNQHGRLSPIVIAIRFAWVASRIATLVTELSSAS